jgi:nucleoside transporter
VTLALRLRLSALFLLQYLAVGSWFVTLGTYMSKSLGFDAIIGSTFGMIGLATIVSALFAGMIADRFVATERMLAILMLFAAGTLFWLSTIQHSRALFLTVMFLHSIFYSCGIPLAVALAFNSMADPQSEYPSVRVFGSIGFIIAGLVVGLIPGAGSSALPMRIGTVVNLVGAAYCLTLPHTPPKAKRTKLDLWSALGLDVVQRVRDASFWILIVAVLVMVIPKKFYDGFLNNYLVEKSVVFQFGWLRVEPTAVQTLGQVMEMITLLFLPVMIARLGIKRVMIIGMLGWIVRFLLWAYGFRGSAGIMPMIVAGILMHGLSYDFFFVSAQIWLDTRFPPETRARVQAFYWFILSGVGVVLASNIAGVVYGHFTVSSSSHGWTMIWLSPALITLVMLAIFAGYFRETKVPVMQRDGP